MPKYSNDHSKKVRRVLTLSLTRDCNLNCAYCYEKNAPRDNVIMDTKVAQDAIQKYMEIDDDFDLVEIQFFGGEPMLAFNRLKEIVEWALSKKWKKEYFFSIGTNGTILTEEMKNFFERHRNKIEISISIDGGKKAQDLCRSNSYDLIKENLPFFMKHWSPQAAKMTICDQTIPFVSESIIELENLGLNFTSNVVFEDVWGSSKRKKKLLEKYAEQLNILVNFYLENNDLFPPTILDKKIEFLGNNEEDKNNDKYQRWCGAGQEMVMADVDGNYSGCHRFSKWITGKEDLYDLNNYNKGWGPDKCNNCNLLKICPTCAGFNWEMNGDPYIRTTYHCEFFKIELMATARLQALKLGKIKEDEFKSNDLYQKYYTKERINGIKFVMENAF